MQKFVCTNCSYTYYPFFGEEEDSVPPGTDFHDIDEAWRCPSCGEGKDAFMGITEHIQEVYSEASMTPEEEQHIPFYRVENGTISVTIGREGNFHPHDEDHAIEYVGVFDEYGEALELIYQPKTEDGESIVFHVEDVEVCEVRAACNVHGTWKGILVDESP